MTDDPRRLLDGEARTHLLAYRRTTRPGAASTRAAWHRLTAALDGRTPVRPRRTLTAVTALLAAVGIVLAFARPPGRPPRSDSGAGGSEGAGGEVDAVAGRSGTAPPA